MNYTLHQLRIFHAVARECSISRASELLNMSQPSVSIQLKNLQDQFEIPLTERIGRNIHITDFGKSIAAVCDTILEDIQLIEQTVSNYKGILTGKLRISIVSTAKYVMPYLLEGFMRKYPNVEIAVDVTNKKRVVRSLEENQCDFALVSVLPETLNLNAVYIMENRLQLFCNPKYHPVIRDATELVGKTLIYRESGSATRNAMEKFATDNNLIDNKKMVLVSNEAVKQAVIAGLGYSLMPEIGLRNATQRGSLQAIKLDGLPLTTQWNLVYEKQKKLTPAALALVEYIKENKDHIIASAFDEQ